MDIQSKIQEIKKLSRRISELSDAMEDGEADKQALVELEKSCVELYRSVISLGISQELKKTLSALIPAETTPSSQEEDAENQLAIDFTKEPIVEKSIPISLPISDSASTPDNLKLLSIGVNDKFRIMKELFDGSTQEYNIAINQLNSITRKREAELYVESLKNIYHWKEENECLLLFIEIINKRFG